MKSSNLIVSITLALFFISLSSCMKTEIVGPATYKDPAGDPAHAPGSGVIADPAIPVKITTTSPLANIYYTLDGSTPSAVNGFLYSNSFTLGLSAGNPNRTLKSIALVTGWNDSGVTTSVYTLVTPVGKWLLNENSGAATFLNLSNTNFTLAAWINSASVTNTYEICGKYAYPNNGYQFNLTSSRFLNFTAYNGASISVTGTGTVPTGWVHVAMTLKARAVNFYINGVFSSTGTLSADMVPSSNASFIISHSYTPGCFIGAIDNLRVYDCVLDSTNIANLYSLGL